MEFTEFLDKMKIKYKDSVVVKYNGEEKIIPDHLPQPLKEFYQIYDYVEFPFGGIYPLHVTLKEDEPFKSEGWLCFGFDGYFSYWLCKKDFDAAGENFTSWDHEMDDKIEAMQGNFVEFLMDMENEYEAECEVVIIKKVQDKKLAAKIKKDFSSSLSISEFVKSCDTVPFVIRDDMDYKTALQIILDNEEYEEYIKVDLI